MISEAPSINWKDILDKFSSYEGTIVEFCKQNNIKPHQLYYQRKRSENTAAPVFHAVRFREKNSDETIEEAISSNPYSGSVIKIKIGKAKMYIPGNDKVSLSNILKAIIQSC